MGQRGPLAVHADLISGGASSPVSTYLESLGLPALTQRLRDAGDLTYVLTGSLAAELVAYAPARLAMLYVDDPAHAEQALALRDTERGANVVLAAASDDYVFDRSATVDGLRVAAASQVAVDLLSGPGRNPSEATALLDWMEANEPAWRRGAADRRPAGPARRAASARGPPRCAGCDRRQGDLSAHRRTR